VIRYAPLRFPERRSAATLAIANDAFVGGADVGFDAGIVDFFDGLTGAADERDDAELLFDGADGRKIDFPEIEMGIEEGYAVRVPAGLRAEVADNADFGFFVLFGPTEDEVLLRVKLVAGKNAGAVKAEEDGGGGLGENTATYVAPNEEDGDFLRNASTTAHNLWWQVEGQ
jgi:hypothetical protein